MTWARQFISLVYCVYTDLCMGMVSKAFADKIKEYYEKNYD